MRADLDPSKRAAILKSAYLAMARFHASRGEPELHVEWLRRADEIDATDVELTLDIADAEWALKRTTAAVEFYQKALRLSPNHPARSRILQRLVEVEGGDPADGHP